MTEQLIETTEPKTTEAANEDGLFDRLLERVKEVLPDFLKPQTDSAFSVYKSLSGELRWTATFTNNFIDRDKEIISEKALDGYLTRIDMGLVPLPELWEAHVPETKFGQADMVFAVGNFVIADGHFDSDEVSQNAAKFYQKNAAKTQISHGFKFPDWGFKNGIYDVINSFEITLLTPPLMASNPYTDLEVKESMKQITPDQEAALTRSRGKEFVENLKAARLADSKELVEAGVAFKDFADVSEVATEEQPVTENPAMSQLIIDLHEGMAELERLLGAAGKAYTALKAAAEAEKSAAAEQATAQEARIKALETATEKLQAELNRTPRAASTAAETKLSDKEAAALKAEAEKSEADPFWNVGV